MEHSQAVPSKVAALIREAMKDSKISQRTLCELTGIPIATLNRRLNGHAPFDLRELYVIAANLDFKPSEIVRLAEDEAWALDAAA